MKKILAALLVVLAVSACNDDDNLTAVFSIKVDSKIDPVNYKSWVIVRNSSDGSLIGYKKVLPGKTLLFETNQFVAGNKIDVTLLKGADYTMYGPSHIYSAMVYTNVDAGSEWAMSAYPERKFSPMPDMGYGLTINNLPALNNNEYNAVISDNQRYSSRLMYDGSKFFETFLFVPTTKQLLSVDVGDGNQKYMFLENIGSGENIQVNFADLKPFDKTMTINFPKALMPDVSVIGLDSNPDQSTYTTDSFDGYQLYSSYYNSESTSITSVTIPFLNEIPVYKVRVVTPEFNYFSIGAIPSSIDYTEASAFEITNQSLENFAFNTNNSYKFRRTSFSYNSFEVADNYWQLNITFVTGTEPAKYYQPIPDDLVQQFSIPVDKVEFSRAEFAIKGLNYSQVLSLPKDIYGNFHLPAPPYETATVIVSKD